MVNEVLIWLAFGLGQGEAIRTFFTDCIGSTLIAVDLTEIKLPERGFLTVIEQERCGGEKQSKIKKNYHF